MKRKGKNSGNGTAQPARKWSVCARSAFLNGSVFTLRHIIFSIIIGLLIGCQTERTGGPIVDPPNDKGGPSLDPFNNWSAKQTSTETGETTQQTAAAAGSSAGIPVTSPTPGNESPIGNPITTPTDAPSDNTANGAAGASNTGGYGGEDISPPPAPQGGTGDTDFNGAPGNADPSEEPDEQDPPIGPLDLEDHQMYDNPWDLIGIVSHILIIEGRPGSLQEHQVLWVWNLDTSFAPVIVTPETDGSFHIQLLYDYGDELRFQVRENDHYYDPTDLQLLEQSGQFVPIATLPCISVVKQLSIQGSAQFTLYNRCTEAIVIDELSWHTNSASIWVEQLTGVVIYPYSSQDIHLQSTDDSNLRWTDEDILLMTVLYGNQAFRLAVNVYIQ